MHNTLKMSLDDVISVVRYTDFREPQIYEPISPYIAEFLIHLIRRIDTLENRVFYE